MKYAEKLKDPRWQKKRLEILQRDDFCCVACMDNEKMLVVHHLVYPVGLEPWDVKNEYLITLCEECHKSEYEFMPKAQQELVFAVKRSGFMWKDIVKIISGFHSLKIIYAPEVTASIIEFILSNDSLMEHCADLFFDSTRKV
jgi:hypothetical protein